VSAAEVQAAYRTWPMDGLLEGTGKGMRHVNLREPKDADRPAVKRLTRQAFRMGGTDMGVRNT